MNSEFKNAPPRYDPSVLENKNDEALRIKLLKCAKKYPECFSRLSKRVSFEKFNESVNRKFTRLTIPDAKRIFQMFDPMNIGYIEGDDMIRQAELGSKSGIIGDFSKKNHIVENGLNNNNGSDSVTGSQKSVDFDLTNIWNKKSANFENEKIDNKINNNQKEENENFGESGTFVAKSSNDIYQNGHNGLNNDDIDNSNNHVKNNDKNIREAVRTICGQNMHLLEFCFSSSDKKKNRKVNFELFIKLLKEGGLCNNMKSVRGLFLALDGQSGSANIDQVFIIIIFIELFILIIYI